MVMIIMIDITFAALWVFTNTWLQLIRSKAIVSKAEKADLTKDSYRTFSKTTVSVAKLRYRSLIAAEHFARTQCACRSLMCAPAAYPTGSGCRARIWSTGGSCCQSTRRPCTRPVSCEGSTCRLLGCIAHLFTGNNICTHKTPKALV